MEPRDDQHNCTLLSVNCNTCERHYYTHVHNQTYQDVYTEQRETIAQAKSVCTVLLSTTMEDNKPRENLFNRMHAT